MATERFTSIRLLNVSSEKLAKLQALMNDPALRFRSNTKSDMRFTVQEAISTHPGTSEIYFQVIIKIDLEDARPRETEPGFRFDLDAWRTAQICDGAERIWKIVLMP